MLDRTIRLLSLCAIASGCSAVRPPPGQPGGMQDPRGLYRFTRGEDFSDLKISPLGTNLAITSLVGGRTRLGFFRTADRALIGGFVLPEHMVILNLEWGSEDRIVADIGRQLGPLDIPVKYGEIISINVTGTDARTIFGYRTAGSQTGTHIRAGEMRRAWGEVMRRVPGHENKVLVKSLPWYDQEYLDAQTDVFEVDVRTGVSQRMSTGPGIVHRYLIDEKGAVRLALTFGPELIWNTFSRDLARREWHPLDQLKGVSRHALPFGVSDAAHSLYVADSDGAERGLYAIALDTGERRLLARLPGVEPSEVVLDAERGTPVAVAYEADYPKWEILDDSRPAAKLLARLKDDFPGQHAVLTSMTDDGRQAIARVYSDKSPGTYVLVRLEPPQTTALFAVREGFDPAAASPVEAIKVRASDGLEIHGYLTLPAKGPERDLPLVVMPHGGPHGVRDRWSFVPAAQLFAASGFAVLQVNFRGSGGYGQTFMDAGARRWDDRVQDDIIETTRWLIAEHIADPKRICIFGGSFGAYSAMQSAIRAPGLFQCAVGYAGIYDLALLHEEGDVPKTARGRAYLKHVVGEDPEALRRASPAHNADKISVPVLLIHGEEDQRAPIAHAKAFAEALAQHHKPFETL